MSSRSAELAATLSFWVPGLGQLYARAWRRGFTIVLTSSLLSTLAWQEMSADTIWACRWPESPGQALFWWGLSIAIWLWNIRDASHLACASQ